MKIIENLIAINAMPELLSAETREMMERHGMYSDLQSARKRTKSEFKIDQKMKDFTMGHIRVSPQLPRSNTATNLEDYEHPDPKQPDSKQFDPRQSMVNLSYSAERPATGSIVRPGTGRTDRTERSIRSDHSRASTHVGVPSLVDKLRSGAQPTIVDGVRLSEFSRSGSSNGSAMSSSYHGLNHFERYSTKNTPGGHGSPFSRREISFTPKTVFDQDAIEEFAEIITAEELPRSIPATEQNEFKVVGQGTYSYDGNIKFKI